jgi:predicted TPR repeat methyltransferase
VPLLLARTVAIMCLSVACRRLAAVIAVFLAALSTCDEQTTEALFRKSASEWQSTRMTNWKPWHDFLDVLSDQFETTTIHRLEIIGGFEEAILLIEQYVFDEGERPDPKRDHVLSLMYLAYGHALSLLTANECIELARDSHTLLIGAETVQPNEPASDYLCMENAENSLRNAVTLDPTNKIARDRLQLILDDTDTEQKRKPKEFVAQLFDSFAISFDEQLSKLNYTVPRLVGRAAESLMASSSYRACLDAGCGTGLVGSFLRPLVSEVMVGVDASKKMLDIAAQCTRSSGCGVSEKMGSEKNDNRSLYDSLLVLDLEDMTLENTLKPVSKDTPGFDLIVAADVFVYFGSLEKIIGTFASLSAPGAALVFSCEMTEDADTRHGWKVLPTGRFAHTKQHAVSTASQAGYQLVSYKEIVPRTEKGEDVRGHLFGFVLARPDVDEL